MAGTNYNTGWNDGVFNIIFGSGEQLVDPDPKGTQDADSVGDLESGPINLLERRLLA